MAAAQASVLVTFQEELGVPLFMASTAMQIFQQGKSRHPDGDNCICTQIMEDIVGAELHR